MLTEKFVPRVTVVEAGETATSAAWADAAKPAHTKKASAHNRVKARHNGVLGRFPPDRTATGFAL
jgi:hypothetical protein